MPAAITARTTRSIRDDHDQADSYGANLIKQILNAITVPPTARIRQAAKIIQENPVKIVLVCDESGRLLGTVTDGDIRRAVLQSADLDGTVDSIMNRHPKVARRSDNRRALREYMRTAIIRHLPCVDKDMHIVDLILLDEVEDVRPRAAAVVLMAGGRGQRLMPLTEKTPKPLLKIGEKPVLERQIEQLAGHGFTRFYISINYLGHMIEEYFGNGERLGVDIRYIREAAPLGTAGALSLLEPQQDPIVVMNGDIITKADFATMVDYFEEEKVVATMGVREYFYTVPYGCVNVNGSAIIDLEEKPTFRHLISAGINVLNPRALEFVPKGEYLDMPQLFSTLIESGCKTNTFQITEEWIDIGHKEDLTWAQKVFAIEDKF
ncbi:MAG: Glucose-1-phosphate adenylyltransferase [Gammaproteobacteria bacterium]|nr:Glucose-1-phosphate adenylyltransferase [Gammaproteobacteria bacterium]